MLEKDRTFLKFNSISFPSKKLPIEQRTVFAVCEVETSLTEGRDPSVSFRCDWCREKHVGYADNCEQSVAERVHETRYPFG